MLLDPEKHFARVTARQMAPRTVEQRQRDVYDSHRHRVFSVSYYMTGSELQAEDLLQGTFVHAFHRAEEPDRELIDTSLLAQLRAQEVLRDGEAEMPIPESGPLPANRNVLRTDLEQAIRYLPCTERLIFLLMDVEGYPTQRIAELMNMSTGEVLRAAFRARIRLRAELTAMQEPDQRAA